LHGFHDNLEYDNGLEAAGKGCKYEGKEGCSEYVMEKRIREYVGISVSENVFGFWLNF
jgi:hypothetical protein